MRLDADTPLIWRFTDPYAVVLPDESLMIDPEAVRTVLRARKRAEAKRLLEEIAEEDAS